MHGLCPPTLSGSIAPLLPVCTSWAPCWPYPPDGGPPARLCPSAHRRNSKAGFVLQAETWKLFYTVCSPESLDGWLNVLSLLPVDLCYETIKLWKEYEARVCVVSVPWSDKISWTASTHSLESNTEANLAAGPTPQIPTDGCCSLSELSDPCCVQAQRVTVGTAGGGRQIPGSDLLHCTTWQLLIGLSWEF